MRRPNSVPFERTFRQTRPVLVAGVFALLIGAVPVALAQTQVGSGSPTVEQYRSAPAERIVLHGVYLRTSSDKIGKSSLAVLNTAVAIIKENPNSFVYVTVRGLPNEACNPKPKQIDRQMRVVATYFVRRGISADRLITVTSKDTKYASRADNAAHSSEPTLVIVQLDLISDMD